DELVDAATTDASGKFRFAGLAPGIHVLRAGNDDRLGQRQELELVRGITQNAALDLSRVCTLVIGVKDAQGPLASADVRLFAKGSIDHRVEKTDEHGSASFEMLRLGTYDVEARRADRGKASTTIV